jgi:DNA polymerase/3'-5' exonuclease PolX
MNNREIAAVLFNISVILRGQDGNPYRVRAYRRAARWLLRIRQPLSERVARDLPLGIPRLGKSLTAKITALARDGRLAFYDELLETLPFDEARLVRVPGIGPTIAARIHRDLGPIDPRSLRRAAAEGRLTRVWGVGPRRQAAILAALAPDDEAQREQEAWCRQLPLFPMAA